jgi:hypothetical protein
MRTYWCGQLTGWTEDLGGLSSSLPLAHMAPPSLLGSGRLRTKRTGFCC